MAPDELADLRRKLAAAVRKVCPRWLADHADDIVQSAILKVMRLEEKGEGSKAQSSSYLWRIAYSATIDELRRRRALREDVLDEPGRSPLPDPERLALARELGAGIQDCLARLVADRRLAVTLYLQGHGVPESARLLGWNEKRVENLVYRGLADLRGCLAGKGLEP